MSLLIAIALTQPYYWRDTFNDQFVGFPVTVGASHDGEASVPILTSLLRGIMRNTVGGQDSEPNFVVPWRSWTTIACRRVWGYPPFQMTTMTC